jgi:carboxylesterase
MTHHPRRLPRPTNDEGIAMVLALLFMLTFSSLGAAMLVLGRTDPIARLAPVLQHVLPYVPRDLAGMPTDDLAKPGVVEHAYAWVPARAAQSFIVELPRIRTGLARIGCPALVVTSPEDHTVDPGNGDAIAEGMVGSPRVERFTTRRSYHQPLLDYDAEELEERIVTFVGDVTGT